MVQQGPENKAAMRKCMPVSIPFKPEVHEHCYVVFNTVWPDFNRTEYFGHIVALSHDELKLTVRKIGTDSTRPFPPSVNLMRRTTVPVEHTLRKPEDGRMVLF